MRRSLWVAIGWVPLVALFLFGCKSKDTEARAVQAINEMGGCFEHDLTVPGHAKTRVDLSGKENVTDARLKELAELKQLQELNLWGTPVTDAGVAELRTKLPGCNIAK